MTLLEKLKQSKEINKFGWFSEEDRLNVAKALSEYIDEKGATQSLKACYDLCLAIGIDADRHGLDSVYMRYLTNQQNPYLKIKFGINSITIKKAIVLWNRMKNPNKEFSVNFSIKANNLKKGGGSKTLLYKTENGLITYLTERLKECPPTMNYEFLVSSND